MPVYSLGNRSQSYVKTSRQKVYWMIDFDIPNHLRNTTPFVELVKVDGVFCMGVYCDPQIGDLLPYNGHLWKVIARVITPARRNSKDANILPTILTEYVREL